MQFSIKKSFNWPNTISVIRVLLVLLIISLLFIDNFNFKVTAFILAIIIIPLDALDGYLARKLKQETRIGALLDIFSDRLVEFLFWVAFASFGLVVIWVPIIIITRGLATDIIRSFAMKKNIEPFKMMHGKFTTWLVASKFNRFFYAFLKAVVFPWLILQMLLSTAPDWFIITGQILVWLTVAYCILRGIPVLWDAYYLFKRKK
ncbi:MAG: CDP-alcohol phosphatidyltransferase family protein [Patescibacteria group bacterium]|jgi:phosphatidylglycerophosphate synthase